MLVLGDDTGSFLAIVRSLGRRGIEMHAAPRLLSAPALKSRFIAKRHDVPEWADDPAAWVRAVIDILTAEHFDLVIPCDETSLLPLAANRRVFEPLARLAIPDDGSIEVLFDKHATRQLAQRLGIPVPPGRLPRPDDTAESLVAEFGLPLMVKPRRSFSLDGLSRRRMVTAAADQAEIASVLPTIGPETEFFEGFVPGRGLGVSILAHRGRLLQVFQHQRVREDSSGSYYRVSAPVAERYREAVAGIVSALNYTGVAMFEFRADEADDSWVLLEVNARPWGSLPLAVNAGVDFPWCWYRLLVAGDELPPMPYCVGLYGRNLVPDLRAVVRRLHGNTWAGIKQLTEFARVFVGRERHDVLTIDDLAPGLEEIGRLAGSVWRSLAAAIPWARALRRYRARRVVASVLRNCAPTTTLLFVCQGNICRSPFAAAVFGLDDVNVRRSGISVGSAGLLARPGRSTPEAGVRAASVEGINLGQHRSRFLTAADADAAALIVLFDRINVEWLRARYPKLKTPFVMLGDLVGEGELDDPVDGNAAEFAACYAKIRVWLRAVTSLLPA